MFTVTMARAILVTICEIGLGEMVGIDPIACQPLRDPSRCPIRPVQALVGARPRVNAVEVVSCKGIEDGGPFCNLSATHQNSKGTCFLLSRTPRTAVQNGQRGLASVRGWAAWASLSPVLLSIFLFFFKITLEIHGKM
jgi:hypothetical protein